MKNVLMKTAVFAVVLFLLAGTALAQQGNGKRHGNGNGKNSDKRLYDVSTVESIKGEVSAVEETSSCSGNGIHIKVSTDTGVIPVHLGPSFYAEKIELNVEKGDNITVIGSKITYEGAEVIVAREVTTDDKTFTLRDMDGTPEWRGQGYGKNKN